MKLIPNRGIKSSVDFASLLKPQSENRFKRLPPVKPIFNLSLYVPIMKCNCGALFHFAFWLRGPVMEKNTIKIVTGKIAHALWPWDALHHRDKIKHSKAAARGKKPQCWVPWVSCLKSKTIGHPGIALSEEVKLALRRLKAVTRKKERKITAPVLPTGQICIFVFTRDNLYFSLSVPLYFTQCGLKLAWEKKLRKWCRLFPTPLQESMLFHLIWADE